MYKVLIAAIVLVSAASAAIFPSPNSTTVNDFADLLPAAQEAKLSDQLEQLAEKSGVQMTVLTLASQKSFAPELTLEQFSTQLFDHWGIGNAERNDGVLILILHDDRAMRLELGRAFGHDWDDVASDVVNNEFVGAFADGNYPRGIMNGTTATIDRIVMPFLAGNPAPQTGKPELLPWIIGVVLAFSALLTNKQRISDFTTRLRKCPSCGRRSLQASRTITMPATTTISGKGIRKIFCTHCNHHAEEPYLISKVSTKPSSRGFGGGSSGGGGASGRW